MNKTFLRWLKNEHPEIIKEYQDMLKGACEELKSFIKKGEYKEVHCDVCHSLGYDCRDWGHMCCKELIRKRHDEGISTI